MEATAITRRDRIAILEDELSNFRSMMEYVNSIPDEISLVNIEAFGQTLSLIHI